MELEAAVTDLDGSGAPVVSCEGQCYETYKQTEDDKVHMQLALGYH